jgi:hypothetical protein
MDKENRAKNKEKYFRIELLPFWVKKKCKFCGGKCVKEPKMVKQKTTTTGESKIGKYVIEETRITPEYCCTNCHAVFSIDEMRKK